MKTLILAALATLFTSNAFAFRTCEDTVVPLAIAMAEASGRVQLNKKLFVDVSMDYTEIVVTLTTIDNKEEGRFLLTMSEDYVQRRQCVVKKIEAL